MMRVVVEHDPARRLALDLEPPADSRKAGQRARRHAEFDSDGERDAHRRERIQRDVASRRRHLDRAQLAAGADHREPRREAVDHDIRGAQLGVVRDSVGQHGLAHRRAAARAR